MLIALAIAVSSRVGAQPARPLWHGAAHSSRAGLPAVSIDLGYPGPYVPAINTPLVLHAVASDVRFDGYIGFHLAVGGRNTLDAPVMVRANLRPHAPWSFGTIITMHQSNANSNNRPLPRELVIEWRNHAMDLVAEQSAGVPPWTTFTQEPLSLCIDCSTAFGASAYREVTGGLSDVAQWYAGFSSIVVALPVWLDLPQRVKKAIFGSGIYVVLIGAPRPAQQLDAITRALLPVTFAPQAGSYVAPWPYRNAGPIASRVSWRAKQGAGAAEVANALPYIVRTETAAWVADADALARPLPSAVPAARRNRLWKFGQSSILSGVEHDYRSAIFGALALVIAVLAWILLRKDRFAIAGALVIFGATAIAVEHQRFGPNPGGSEHVLRASVAPGVAMTLRDFMQYGPAPLTAPRVERTSLTGDYGMWWERELRTSQTSPSMGELHRDYDWDAAMRWSFRRELAATDAMPVMIGWHFDDFHGSTELWSLVPVSGDGRYQINGDVHTVADGRMSTDFALPPHVGNATLYPTVPLMGGPIELSWENGTVLLQPVQKDPYTAARCAIPSAILRAMDATGGIITVTLTPRKRVVHPTYRVILEVQEKKS